MHLLTRLDRQPSPPPTANQDKSSDDANAAATVATSEPGPAPPPSWLRSNSTSLQDLHSRAVLDDCDIDTGHRPTRTSTRSSGVRRQLLTQQNSYPELSKSQPNSRPGSRPVSGRMSGIRGELHSRRNSRPPSGNPLSSTSDSHLPTFLDGEGYSTGDEGPRLKTAVLAKGRRPLRLNSSGSDTCLIPIIGDDVTTPTVSHTEPDLSSTHFDPAHPHPHHSERQSLDECLESITKFDHLHLGQMSSNIQGTYIHTIQHVH